MQVDGPEKLRNLAVVGHSDTGKTSLASALLYAGGMVNRLNRIEDGNTTTDFDAEEIARGISIGLATCHISWRQHKINLLDCPGYGIFFTEAEAGIAAADAALLCINAVAGIEVSTERTWKFARYAQAPVMIHLTKMDRERANLEQNLAQLRESFGREIVPIQIPIGEAHDFRGVVDLVAEKAYIYATGGDGKAAPGPIPAELADKAAAARAELLEAVAETDDSLLETFFDQGTLSQEQLVSGLRSAILARRLVPITLGSSTTGVGQSALLDAIVDLMPSPLEGPAYDATTFSGERCSVERAANGKVVALVFKTLSDPFTGKVSLLRVVRGILSSDSNIWNTQTEGPEKVGHLMVYQGKQGTAVANLVAGDIGGVAKLKNTHSGNALCDKTEPVALAWRQPPEPAIAFAIEPKSKGDEEKIGEALQRLMEEDTNLHTSRDPETGEYLLSGTGQLHVEIAVARLKSRFHVEVLLHPPKVPYRETVRRTASGHGRHKKQSGGRGQFADCRIEIEPLRDGQDFDFVDEIFGGSIPQQYRPAVEKGIGEARKRGFLAGFPLVGFRVRLKDGQYHDVDSSEMAFKIAGSLAFKDAVAKAAPTILEPIMKVEISVAEEFLGDIMSDLSQRRGRPLGMESRDGTHVISAGAPMAEMLNYAPSLRAMTQGRGSFHSEFSHYEEVPRQVQIKIIEEAQKPDADHD